MKTILEKKIHFLPGRIGLILITVVFLISCKKAVEIDKLNDQLLSSEVFKEEGTANSAISGIYSQMRFRMFTGNPYSQLCGLSSDELLNRVSNATDDAYRTNSILPASTSWAGNYNVIYACNAAIEGLELNAKFSDRLKYQYIGEARFVRAFVYYYLVNLFGDVPLITTTNVAISSNTIRTKSNFVYDQIIDDLKYAQDKLGKEYISNSGDKTRANSLAATALLARVYLQQGDFINAEIQSNAVISSGQYSLIKITEGIYSKNNLEAILQIANTPTAINSEASLFNIANPSYVFTSSMINAFEDNDQRKEKWMRKVVNGVSSVYAPFKFTSTAIGNAEQTTLLRLGEQYLIRAEARINLDKVSKGIEDLNIIRRRASLPIPNNLADLSPDLSKKDAQQAVENERRKELFAENGLRWLDLKRNSKMNEIMLLEKPLTWKSYASLWPIPLGDILKIPNLKQNPGYD